MRPILSLPLLMILLYSCGSTYEYWDISKFNMKPDALQNGEEIKLVYSSRGPGDNKDLEYYIHIIAVSQKTGDTVNILTTAENGFTIEDKDKVFNYLNHDNFVSKIAQTNLDDIDKIINVDQINNIELKDIKKVARDPKFDYLQITIFQR